MEKNNINWFPGHMRKALNDTKENLKLVDMVFETCDARIPFSSRNPELDKIIGNKKRIVLLSKSDLADPAVTSRWIEHFNKRGVIAIPIESFNKKSIDKLIAESKKLCSDILDKAANKGRSGKTIRVMVVGVPNTGKSTLINSLSGKKSAVTGDKPGVTRAPKWIRTSYFDLMDMPGVLWPSIASKRSSYVLAATGAIKSEVVDFNEIAYMSSNILWELYPKLMEDRYKISKYLEEYDRFLAMGKTMGTIMSGGRINEDRLSLKILDDIKSGRIGRISFEVPIDE